MVTIRYVPSFSLLCPNGTDSIRSTESPCLSLYQIPHPPPTGRVSVSYLGRTTLSTGVTPYDVGSVTRFESRVPFRVLPFCTRGPLPPTTTVGYSLKVDPLSTRGRSGTREEQEFDENLRTTRSGVSSPVFLPYPRRTVEIFDSVRDLVQVLRIRTEKRKTSGEVRYDEKEERRDQDECVGDPMDLRLYFWMRVSCYGSRTWDQYTSSHLSPDGPALPALPSLPGAPLFPLGPSHPGTRIGRPLLTSNLDIDRVVETHETIPSDLCTKKEGSSAQGVTRWSTVCSPTRLGGTRRRSWVDGIEEEILGA